MDIRSAAVNVALGRLEHSLLGAVPSRAARARDRAGAGVAVVPAPE